MDAQNIMSQFIQWELVRHNGESAGEPGSSPSLPEACSVTVGQSLTPHNKVVVVCVGGK